jgi:hypothetical protein
MLRAAARYGVCCHCAYCGYGFLAVKFFNVWRIRSRLSFTCPKVLTRGVKHEIPSSRHSDRNDFGCLYCRANRNADARANSSDDCCSDSYRNECADANIFTDIRTNACSISDADCHANPKPFSYTHANTAHCAVC